MNNPQMYSDELTDFNEEFSFEVEIWRQKLAQQLLVDIKNVEDSFAQVLKQKQAQGQSTQELKQKIFQQQSAFVEIYQQKIDKLEKLKTQADCRNKEDELPQLLQALDFLKKQQAQLNLTGTLDLFKQLTQKQSQTISQLQTYLETLCQRIKHENYAQRQKQIEQYLESQIIVFGKRKEQIREIIHKVNSQREKWYDVARKLCQTKQQQIQQLQKIKTQTQQKLQKEKQTALQLNMKEKQLFNQISNLTLTLNINLLTSKSQLSDRNKNKRVSHHASEKEFKSKNFGSIIESQPQREKDNPSLIFSPQISSSNEIKTPVCQVSSSMGKEVNNNKFIILILSILTIGLWFAWFY